MRNSLRCVVGAALTAFAVAVPGVLGVPAAHAEDVTTTALDVAADYLQAGCTPVIYSWDPVPLTMTPHVVGASTWYKETGGGIAHANCPGTYKTKTRLLDTSAPPFLPYMGRWTTTTYTGRDPKGVGTNDVPYFGPDAPVLRPYGDITVHVEVYRRVGTTNRYAAVGGGCMEWEYAAVPEAAVSKDLPTSAPCKHTATFLAFDVAEGGGIESIEGIDGGGSSDGSGGFVYDFADTKVEYTSVNF